MNHHWFNICWTCFGYRPGSVPSLVNEAKHKSEIFDRSCSGSPQKRILQIFDGKMWWIDEGQTFHGFQTCYHCPGFNLKWINFIDKNTKREGLFLTFATLPPSRKDKSWWKRWSSFNSSRFIRFSWTPFVTAIITSMEWYHLKPDKTTLAKGSLGSTWATSGSDLGSSFEASFSTFSLEKNRLGAAKVEHGTWEWVMFLDWISCLKLEDAFRDTWQIRPRRVKALQLFMSQLLITVIKGHLRRIIIMTFVTCTAMSAISCFLFWKWFWSAL